MVETDGRDRGICEFDDRVRVCCGIGEEGFAETALRGGLLGQWGFIYCHRDYELGRDEINRNA